MRTKIMVLSALLGTLGTASLMAQSTNVYSLNAVGYINVTVYPGFNQVTVPLIASPDNTVGTVLNNGGGALTGSTVYFYNASAGTYSLDNAAPVGSGRGNTLNTNGWVNNGTNVANPGTGFWFQNNGTTNIVLTFVGTVPQGSLTNVLVPGFNLVGSAVPTSGDLITNSITSLTNYNIGDSVYIFNPLNPPSSQYTIYTSAPNTGRGSGGYGYNLTWDAPGDPQIPSVGQGFWYDNSSTTVTWVENFSVSQ